MLKELLGVDLDIERITQVVESVWEDRDKISESVNLVWENREQFMNVLNFVRDNQEMLLQVLHFVQNQRERLLDMLDNLPELLGQTGICIEAAGNSALRASTFLTGSDGDPDSLSANDLANVAALVLERCQSEIQNAAQIMKVVGNEVDGLTIPSISPKYSEVMGFNVISGLEIGDEPLIDDAAGRLRRGSDRLDLIGSELQTFAIQMRKLGSALTDVGNNLNEVGEQLTTSGGTLRNLMAAEHKDETVANQRFGIALSNVRVVTQTAPFKVAVAPAKPAASSQKSTEQPKSVAKPSAKPTDSKAGIQSRPSASTTSKPSTAGGNPKPAKAGIKPRTESQSTTKAGKPPPLPEGYLKKKK